MPQLVAMPCARHGVCGVHVVRRTDASHRIASHRIASHRCTALSGPLGKRHAVQCILASVYARRFGVWLVDDASTDRTHALVRSVAQRTAACMSCCRATQRSRESQEAKSHDSAPRCSCARCASGHHRTGHHAPCTMLYGDALEAPRSSATIHPYFSCA